MKPNTPIRTETGWVVKSHVGGMCFHKVFNAKKLGSVKIAYGEGLKFCLFLHEKRKAAEVVAKKIITDCLEEVYDG